MENLAFNYEGRLKVNTIDAIVQPRRPCNTSYAVYSRLHGYVHIDHVIPFNGVIGGVGGGVKVLDLHILERGGVTGCVPGAD